MREHRGPVIAIAEGAFGIIDELAEKLAGKAKLLVGTLDTPESVAALTEGADALVVTLHPLRAEHISALSSSVRVIVRAGVGLDTIDVAAAQERGIRVLFQPNYATHEVADHAASMALASWRRLRQFDAGLRTDGWPSAAQIGPVRSLHESVLGVVGGGRIGRALITRLAPFVGEVVVFDTVRHDMPVEVTWVDSPSKVFRAANLISLHVPLTPETRHLVDTAAIESMPQGVVLVNVSRGGLIDEAALAEALRSGRVGGAGLDVFEGEPLSEDSPLRDAPNTLLTPHVAWYSLESGHRLANWSIQDAYAFVTTGEAEHGCHAWE